MQRPRIAFPFDTLGFTIFIISNLTGIIPAINLFAIVALGFLLIKDDVRKESIEGIRIIKKAGIQTVMITGDNRTTALAIAKEVGIVEDEEKDLILNNELTESLFKVNMKLAEKKFEHRKKYAEYLFKFKNEKSYKEIAQSKLSKEIFDIEVLEEKKMYLYNKLVNVRQELNILSVLLKNEKELM